MGIFCLLVDLHRWGSAPAAWAVGLFFNNQYELDIKGIFLYVAVFPESDRLYLQKKYTVMDAKKLPI